MDSSQFKKRWSELSKTFEKLISLSSSTENGSTSSKVAEELLPSLPSSFSSDILSLPKPEEFLIDDLIMVSERINPTLPLDLEGHLSEIETTEKQNEEEEEDVLALGEDWRFLLDADLGEEEEEETPELKMTSMLHQGSVVDVIDLEELSSTAGEVDELTSTADQLLQTFEENSPAKEKELYRAIHTLKGTLGITGEARARALIHHLETTLDEINDGMHKRIQKKEEVLLFFEKAKILMEEVRSGNWSGAIVASGDGKTDAPVSFTLPKVVHVDVSSIDKIISDVNEGRLDNIAIEEFFVSSRNKYKELEENAQRAFRMLRELELQAEIQIQSRKSQLQEVGEDFDPLEFDRFTKLQELSRITSESIVDILEVRRELTRSSVEQEGLLAHQKRAIVSAQEKLNKTRLVQADAINDRLYKVVRKVAKEEGKNITFEMSGGRVELDRMLLDKITPALEHVIRNSIAHGIELPDIRRQMGKNEAGSILLNIRQEAGRAFIEIHDDGYGLQTNKIKEKAVEKGLWSAQSPMSDAQAAEMICAPNFSTATSVGINAGRGVGMDAVRSSILSMGGKFEIVSHPKKGLSVFIQVPTSIAQASVLVVESGNEEWAFPLEMVEHVVLLNKTSLQSARKLGVFPAEKGLEHWSGASFRWLEDMTGVHSASSIRGDISPVLLLKERGQLLALEVSRLIQVFEVPLRPAGPLWSSVRSVAGTVVLPNGNAIFLLDPFRFQTTQALATDGETITPAVVQKPLVMVVDDSLPVRKATVRFLTKNGYESITAKDGQEALDLLLRIQPAVILLDIEMPKMDGFDCAKNIRDNAKSAHIPIIMITSRTAEKHRQRAQSLGVNEYLGKPFKEDELLELLKTYIKK